MSIPIKKCEYCEATGIMPTSINGETMCYACLARLPSNVQDCRIRIIELESALKRLGSCQAFELAGTTTPELRARIDYAREALEGKDLNGAM